MSKCRLYIDENGNAVKYSESDITDLVEILKNKPEFRTDKIENSTWKFEKTKNDLLRNHNTGIKKSNVLGKFFYSGTYPLMGKENEGYNMVEYVNGKGEFLYAIIKNNGEVHPGYGAKLMNINFAVGIGTNDQETSTDTKTDTLEKQIEDLNKSQNAVQEQTTDEVSVQSEARGGREMEKGISESGSKRTAKKSKKDEITETKIIRDTDPEDIDGIVSKYFITGGRVDRQDALDETIASKRKPVKEREKIKGISTVKGSMTVAQLSHYLWENQPWPNFTDDEFRNAINDFVRQFDGIKKERTKFAQKYSEEFKQQGQIKDYTPLAIELNKKDLTHAKGLGMGQNQFNGTYLSTEDGNRYRDRAEEVVTAHTDVVNPKEMTLDEYFDLKNSLFDSAKQIFKERYPDLANNKLFDDANNFEDFSEIPGGDNFERILSELATDEMRSQGHDSVYFRKTETQEGELIVFDRENVELGSEQQIEPSQLSNEDVSELSEILFPGQKAFVPGGEDVVVPFQKTARGENITTNALHKIAKNLAERLGVSYSVISEAKAQQLLGDKYNGEPAFFHNNRAYFVSGKVKSDSVFHEFSHPFIDALEMHNPQLFQNLYKGLANTQVGKQIINEVNQEYATSSQSQKIKEALVRAISEQAALNIDAKTGNPLTNIVNRILNAIKTMLNGKFFEKGQKVSIKELNPNTSIAEMADILSAGTSDIILNPLTDEALDNVKKIQVALNKRLVALRDARNNNLLSEAEYSKKKSTVFNIVNKIDTNAIEISQSNVLSMLSKEAKVALNTFKNSYPSMTEFQKGVFLASISNLLSTESSIRFMFSDVMGNPLSHGMNDTSKNMFEIYNQLESVYKVRGKEYIEDFLAEEMTEEEKNRFSIGDLLEKSKDISGFEYLQGSLATSSDPLLALLDRKYKKQIFEKNKELSTDVSDLKQAIEEFGSDDYSDFYEIDSSGNPTGKMVSETDPRFDEERTRVLSTMPVDADGNKLKYEEFNSFDTEQERKDKAEHNIKLKNSLDSIDNWIANNEVLDDEFKAKLDDFISSGYIQVSPTGKMFVNPALYTAKNKDQYGILRNFIEENFYGNDRYEIDKKTGEAKIVASPYKDNGVINEDLSAWKPVSSNKKANAKKWTNTKYVAIQNDPRKKKFFDTYKKLLDKYLRKVPEHSFDQSGMVAVKKEIQKGVFELGSLMSSMKDSVKDALDSTIVLDGSETGSLNRIPLMYNVRITQDKQKKLADLETQKAALSDVEEIAKIDKEIEKIQGMMDSSEVETDIGKSLEKFMAMASVYDSKNTIEKGILEFKGALRDRINQTGSYFGEGVRGEKSKEDNNSAKRLDAWLNANVYENTGKNQSRTEVAMDLVRKYTTISTLGLNPKSAFNNAIMGTVNNFIESLGGTFYASKHWLQAQGIYNQNIRSLGTHMMNGDPKDKVSVIMKNWDLFSSLGKELSNAFTEGGMQKATNLMLAMDNAGEHMIKSKIAIATMLSHNIINGKIYSIQDYYDSNPKLADLLKSKDVVGYKNLKDQMTQDFNNAPTVWDSIDTGKGKIDFTVPINKNQEFLFQNKVKGVQDYIHGRYRPEDSSVLNNNAFGKWLVTFKRWTSAAIENRIQGKHYDGRLRTDIEGRYISMWNFAKSLKEYSFNVANAYSTMTEFQKANIRKTGAELAAMIISGILATMISRLGKDYDDDDEWLERKLVHWAGYEMGRINQETGTFFTYGGVSGTLFKDPIAPSRTISNVADFMSELIQLPFSDNNYYEKGVHKGESKFGEAVKKLIPGNQLFKTWTQMDKPTDFNKTNR